MKYLIIIVCFSHPFILHAQIEDFDLERYKLNVKQPDEFMQRFNGETNRNGISINDSLCIEDRNKFIFTLFDNQYIQQAFENNSIKRNISEFTHFVSTNNQRLNFISPYWFAEAECRALYQNKPVGITFILATSIDSSQVAEWKIVGANADFLHVDTIDSVQDHFISPISHNINFTKLSSVLNRPENNHFNFVYDGFEPSDLSLTLFMIKLGLLQIGLVEELTFHFLNYDGWVFTVREFERDEDNAGWLIDQVDKFSNDQKLVYLSSILNVDPVYLINYIEPLMSQTNNH